MRTLPLLIAAIAAAGAPLAAQTGGGLNFPSIIDSEGCDQEGPDSDIIVCGRRRSPDQYRIPPDLREDRTNPVNPSWSARARDQREVGRYDGQAVGPSGALKHAAETVCRWRAERQQIAGHPPDCTRRVRAPGN